MKLMINAYYKILNTKIKFYKFYKNKYRMNEWLIILNKIYIYTISITRIKNNNLK